MIQRRIDELYRDYVSACFEGIARESTFTESELWEAYKMCGFRLDVVIEMSIYSDDVGISDADDAMTEYLHELQQQRVTPYKPTWAEECKVIDERPEGDFLND